MPTYRYNEKEYTLGEIRALFPSVSLPAAPSAADLATLGMTVVPDPEPTPEDLLAQVRAAKLHELGEAFDRAQRESHFCSALGYEVDATERANRDVSGLITVLEATGQIETTFCDYGNEMHTVTLAQLKTLQLEIIVYGQKLYARKWGLREAISMAGTPEAVANIEISFPGGAA